MSCGNCHDPHGADPAQYRNLVLRPGTASVDLNVTYSTADTIVDVKQAVITPTSTQYSMGNIKFNEPDSTGSAYGDWCQGCHTLFHGDTSNTEMYVAPDWVRHPTCDVNLSTVDYGGYSGLTNQVQVMNEGAVLADTATPSCFTCHKAHGNQNPFGMLYMSGSGTLSEEGDDGGSPSTYADTCRQCH
jgi:hypothetical protein